MLMLDEFLMQDEIVDPAPPPTTVRHRFYNEVDDVSVRMYVVDVCACYMQPYMFRQWFVT